MLVCDLYSGQVEQPQSEAVFAQSCSTLNDTTPESRCVTANTEITSLQVNLAEMTRLIAEEVKMRKEHICGTSCKLFEMSLPSDQSHSVINCCLPSLGYSTCAEAVSNDVPAAQPCIPDPDVFTQSDACSQITCMLPPPGLSVKGDDAPAELDSETTSSSPPPGFLSPPLILPESPDWSGASDIVLLEASEVTESHFEFADSITGSTASNKMDSEICHKELPAISRTDGVYQALGEAEEGAERAKPPRKKNARTHRNLGRVAEAALQPVSFELPTRKMEASVPTVATVPKHTRVDLKRAKKVVASAALPFCSLMPETDQGDISSEELRGRSAQHPPFKLVPKPDKESFQSNAGERRCTMKVPTGKKFSAMGMCPYFWFFLVILVCILTGLVKYSVMNRSLEAELPASEVRSCQVPPLESSNELRRCEDSPRLDRE